MVFSSTLFLFLFLPVFLLFYYCVNKIAWRNTVLLIGSLIFYAWGEPVYIVLMVGSILANYIFALRIDESGQERGTPTKKSKRWLLAAVVFNLVLLGVFKYAGFIASNVNILIGLPAPDWNLPLPIGISFYTFQMISYVIDVYRGNIAVQRNGFYLGAYMAAFPQLIAGPIVRYETIEYELLHRKASQADFASGIRRFIVGLSKKVLIANNMAFVADAVLQRTPAEYGMIGAWTALICYTFQIYFDFSGYSDMAIGLGRMLGFHYPENFNYPYIARSVTEFWRRWHISLSSFFRDYVYIPMGGNRVSKARFIVNIMIVWSLTGLWHGSSWNFVIWGAYYGVLLLIEKLLIGNFIKKLPFPVKHIYTMLAVMVGWAIFRMENFGDMMDLLRALAGIYGTSSISFFETISVLQGKYILAAVVAVVAATPVIPALAAKLRSENAERIGLCLLRDAILLTLFLFSVISLVSGGFNPFIYFRF